jgi:eukaryotic-like serine/threonine-protein kinase
MDAQIDDLHLNDEPFAQFVSRLTERLQANEPLQLSDVIAENPEFAAQLREIWGMIVVTDLAASEARQSSSQTSQAVPVHHTKGLNLPARIGDYELQQVLGRGGMGVVYEARQVSLNRQVALKMIQENRPADPEHHARFFKEAEATARLQHPGIVPVYEVGEYEGQPFFTMQLIRGHTLAERLREGPLAQRQAAAILSEVSRAIHYAHSCGILHRDIKPSNIMLEEGGRVCVTDFGLAKLIDSQDSLTRTGATVGTPSYMAPEQAAGRWGQVSVRSDVYSLGAVLYHVLTGRPPFIADSPIHLAMQILEHDPAPVRFLEPGIDRDLEMIVARSIQKPPDLRYATAEALAEDLDSFLRDEPVAARSGKLSEVVARWFRETHHATVLENWGLLWIWHSLVLLTVSFLTQWMHWQNVQSRLSYAALWTIGLGAWAVVFWALRRRMGPVTFVERQIAHIWGASLFCIAALAPLEGLLSLDSLTLSPILPLIGSMVFLAKAGILSGQFYVQALIMLSTSFIMAIYPKFAHLIFGIVAAGCFFVPGLKYYKQRRLALSDRI